MARAFLLLLVACGGTTPPTKPVAPRSLAVVARPAVTARAVADDAQDYVPYVEPPPADWTAPPPAFELPVVPAAATLYATISRIVVVDRAGGVIRGDNKMALPDQIDPATLAPPPRPPAPEPKPGDKPLPRIAIGTGPLTTGPLTIELPKRTLPQHLSGVVADWAGGTILLATVVFAHRDGSAAKIYDAIRSELFVSSTALAVTTDAGVRAYRMTFDNGIGFGPDIDRAYLEIALANDGARVQAIVGDKPAPKTFDRAASDIKAIVTAYTAARKLPQLGKGVTVWIRLVDDDVTYARLLEVLEGLRAAGAVHTALSRARPLGEPFGGVTTSNAVLGKVEAPGNFAALARRYIKRNMNKVDYCHEKELLAKSNLAGEVKLEFTIKTDGTVDALTSTGVDKELSACIGNVIKAIAFPKPKDDTAITVKTTIQLSLPKANRK